MKKYTNNIFIIWEEKLNNINSLRSKQLILRFIAAILIFSSTIFFIQNFNNKYYPLIIIASFLVVVLNYIIATFSGIHDSPLGRAIVGFVTFTIIIYVVQFFVPGFFISLLTSLIAAMLYALIESFLPNRE